MNRIATAFMAASLLYAAPAVADDLDISLREECECGLGQWLVHSELIKSAIRVDGMLAITVDEKILRSLDADARRYVEDCLKVLRAAPDPHDWPLMPPDEEI